MRRLFPLVAITIVSACRTVAPAVAPRPESLRLTAPPIQSLASNAREGSTIVLGLYGPRRLAFVADEDEDAIHTIDLDARRELARTEVAGRPTRLLVLRDGRLAVTLRDAASVAVLAIDDVSSPLLRVANVRTADEPIALAIGDRDDKLLWVASGWGRTLQALDLEKSAVRTTIALGREPRALALSEDGAYVFVGYMSESAITVVNLGAETTGVVELKEGKGGFGRQTFALVRMRVDGTEQVFAPYVMNRPGAAERPFAAYGGSAPGLQVFDLAVIDRTNQSARVAPLSGGLTTCSLPRAAVADPKTESLFVACLGNNTISRHDYAAFATSDVEVPGGPTAMALDDQRRQLLVFALFDRTVTLMPIPTERDAPLKSIGVPIALSHVPGRGLAPDVAMGRRMFYATTDARVANDGRACASCHPDGRDDGLVWPSPTGPRQTAFLAGRLERSGPFGWDAKHKDLATHVRNSAKSLGGKGLDDIAAKQLTDWLHAMPVPPRTERPLSSREELGRELFNSKLTGCSNCHTSGGSDGQAYDIGSATLGDKSRVFLTPSLRYVSGTAPYFHDGRYTSLFSLVQGCDGKMGSTRQLSVTDMRALEAYLRTL